MMGHKVDTDQLFTTLVENALDFFGRAVEEVGNSPKYSVIHFSTAVELILKARLLTEHWSLVFSKLEAAEPEKLVSGEFKSVNFKEARLRLKKIVGEGLSTSERKTFSQLRDHRNQLIHFVPEGHGSGTDEDARRVAVSELCRGWHYLYGLVADRWSDEFAGFEERLGQLNDRMLGMREFLEAKFDTIQPQLTELRSEGVEIRGCLACGFEAVKVGGQPGLLKKLTCLICNWTSSVLEVECPECGEPIWSFELGQGACDNCGFQLRLDWLVEKYGPVLAEEQYFISTLPASCNWCEHHERSVIEWDEGFLCLACLHTHDQVSCCAFCDEPISGSAEDTYLTGCMWCEGKLGWDDS